MTEYAKSRCAAALRIKKASWIFRELITTTTTTRTTRVVFWNPPSGSKNIQNIYSYTAHYWVLSQKQQHTRSQTGGRSKPDCHSAILKVIY